jgi:hypothetical protein
MTNRYMYLSERARAVILGLGAATILLTSEALPQRQPIKMMSLKSSRPATSVAPVLLPSSMLDSDFRMLVGDQSAGD